MSECIKAFQDGTVAVRLCDDETYDTIDGCKIIFFSEDEDFDLSGPPKGFKHVWLEEVVRFYLDNGGCDVSQDV